MSEPGRCVGRVRSGLGLLSPHGLRPLGPQPLHVVCPEQYTQPPPAQSHRMDLMVDCQPPAMSYRRAEVLALPFKRRYEKIEIMPEVSVGLPGVSPGFLLSLWNTVLGWLSLGFVSHTDGPRYTDP